MKVVTHNLTLLQERGLSFDLAFLVAGAAVAVGAPLAVRLSRTARASSRVSRADEITSPTSSH